MKHDINSKQGITPDRDVSNLNAYFLEYRRLVDEALTEGRTKDAFVLLKRFLNWS